jgi:hypothetical protein
MGINFNEYSGDWFGNSVEYNYTDSQWPNVNFDSTTNFQKPCGDDDPSANCAMDACEYNPGKACLNWARNSSYEWSDRKPSSN